MANQDESLDKLKSLLKQGYSKVKWQCTEPYCDKCRDLDEEEWTLVKFIDDLDYDAPIFEHSHVNCDCEIIVSGKGLPDITLDWEGEEK